MVQLKKREWRILDDLLDMSGGVVLDFSNRTFDEFFDDDFGIEIYSDKYSENGESKARRMRAFVAMEPASIVIPVMEALWQHRCDLVATNPDYNYDQEAGTTQYETIMAAINKSSIAVAAPALQQMAQILNFDTVKRDLDRALASVESDPEQALTSACSVTESVCRSILIELGEDLPAKKDIKSLFNAVKKPLRLNPDRTDIDAAIAKDVQMVLSGLASVVNGVGALRTHGGDAHGRERGFKRIDSRIANLAVHSASTISFFLIETWQMRFPDRQLKAHE